MLGPFLSPRRVMMQQTRKGKLQRRSKVTWGPKPNNSNYNINNNGDDDDVCRSSEGPNLYHFSIKFRDTLQNKSLNISLVRSGVSKVWLWGHLGHLECVYTDPRP
ncbi:hypothetical protein CHARACLAT_033064 [Characodon lateralis]|uniref:Uncharacterized protein n=1 Tax=Characodon lateralis TaxID=208331 RepID=A0ABU7F8Q2_9TELE|nr:hypothetical protein [Characodon lateralis]